LPAGQRTIADVFNENGYHTGYFGKWHLGGWHERDGRAAFFITDPARRGGFQTWTGYEHFSSNGLDQQEADGQHHRAGYAMNGERSRLRPARPQND
jgi:arylsulfatase A-like enzyme